MDYKNYRLVKDGMNLVRIKSTKGALFSELRGRFTDNNSAIEAIDKILRKKNK